MQWFSRSGRLPGRRRSAPVWRSRSMEEWAGDGLLQMRSKRLGGRGEEVSGVVRRAFNANLNRLARPEIRALGRPWPAFQICGYTGLGLAILLAMSLARYPGLSPLIMALIVATAVPTFLGLVMATKIITGEERIIYYHHEIAVMLAAAALLWVASQPMLPYLDITILGIGAFLACGRIGCLMVGCCHGRPSRWGIRYTPDHAAAGFTDYYVGVVLSPI